MIKASEARANVMNYELTFRAEVQKEVDKLAETLSQSIGYHSSCGFSIASFAPYDKAIFNSTKALVYAQELFQKLFEDAGYTVAENNYERNSLIIRW